MSVITLHKNVAATPAELVWEEPPAKERRSKYAEIAAAIQERPNDWAVVFTVPASEKSKAWRFSHGINTGRYVDLHKTEQGRFEAVARTTGDTARVYVRYVPTTQAADAPRVVTA